MRSHNTSKHTNRDDGGFSLIETLLVLSVLVVLVTTGIGVSMQTFLRSNLEEERNMLVSLLESERAQAMANIHATTHGLHLSQDAFILFEGVYNDHNASNTVLKRNQHVHNNKDTTILFTQLAGDNENGLQNIILTQNGLSATITVNERGRIDW